MLVSLDKDPLAPAKRPQIQWTAVSIRQLSDEALIAKAQINHEYGLLCSNQLRFSGMNFHDDRSGLKLHHLRAYQI